MLRFPRVEEFAANADLLQIGAASVMQARAAGLAVAVKHRTEDQRGHHLAVDLCGAQRSGLSPSFSRERHHRSSCRRDDLCGLKISSTAR